MLYKKLKAVYKKKHSNRKTLTLAEIFNELYRRVNTKVYHRVYPQKLYHRKIYEIKYNNREKSNFIDIREPSNTKGLHMF